MRRIGHLAIAMASVSGSLLVAAPALASEGGQTQWPLGVQTVMPAVMPPEGKTQLYSYSLYYKASKFNGDNEQPVVPGFDLDVAAQALRVVHTWTQNWRSAAV